MGAEALPYLTPAEAAARLRICTKTLGKLRRDGLIRYVAVTARKVGYLPQDCDDYLESRARYAEPIQSRPRVGKRRLVRTGNVVPITPFIPRRGSAAR